MNDEVKLFRPGTLVVPEMGFWLNVNPAAWKLAIENPSAKMQPFLSSGDKMLLGILLDEFHHGLILKDEVGRHSVCTKAPHIQSYWEYIDGLVKLRVSTLLFGERKVTIRVAEDFLERKNLSITNQGWKVVSKPSP